MRRWAMTLFVPLALAVTTPAWSFDRGPACREASVVDEMSRQIRDGDYYGNIDSRLITEQPTSQPDIVRCQVCVLSKPYNSTRFGDQPIKQCIARDFEVQILKSGFVVRALR